MSNAVDGLLIKMSLQWKKNGIEGKLVISSTGLNKQEKTPAVGTENGDSVSVVQCLRQKREKF